MYLGVKAEAARALGATDMKGVRVAVQGVGSVGGGLARRLAADGAVLTVADVNENRAQALAAELGAATVDAGAILSADADVVSPNALGVILTGNSISALKARVVAGGANNQLATHRDCHRLHEAGVLYAPDYVINAGRFINVSLEYLGQADEAEVLRRVRAIPDRLAEVWDESERSGAPASEVADSIARRLIGR